MRLRNTQAVDITTAVQTFMTNALGVFGTGVQSSPFLIVQRQVVLVAEPISNSILINATCEWFDKVIDLISYLDTTPPQVVVQVLIAEVTMTGSEEFGVEIGLQQPLLFQAARRASRPRPRPISRWSPATTSTIRICPWATMPLLTHRSSGFRG